MNKGVIPFHDFVCLFDRPECRSAENCFDRMGLKFEGYHDPKISAAAADGPEQVGMLGFAYGHKSSVGQNHIGFQQVVDRETEFSGQVTDSPAKRETADAGGRNDAGRNGQTESMGRVIYLAPKIATADAHGIIFCIDAYVFEPGEVDHQTVVDETESAAVMTSAAYGYR